jgi:hypothetical protein
VKEFDSMLANIGMGCSNGVYGLLGWLVLEVIRI